MERFDIGNYLKKKFNIQEYPFASNANLPLSVDKLESLIDEIHDHYCHEAMGDGGNTYEGPELVTEEYAFKKQEEAQVVKLRDDIGELNVVLRKFVSMIGSKNYILAYHDTKGVACYSIGDGVPIKDMLYLQTVLNIQCSIAFQNSNIPKGQ